MNMDHLDDQHDRTEDSGSEECANDLIFQYMSNLIKNGGGSRGRPYLESTLQPEQLEGLLVRAVEMAQNTGCFEQEWHDLQQAFPRMKYAWQKGQLLFQEDLARADGDAKEMNLLSQEYFAADLFAFVSTSFLYFDNATIHNWAINGYMVAWRQHFRASRSRPSG